MPPASLPEHVDAASTPSAGSAAGRTRRFHNKSRLGCKGCKERRIKCDEARPVCANCTRRSAICEYDHPAEDRTESSRSRKSRRRIEQPPLQLTFVDVTESLGLKRRRDDSATDAATPGTVTAEDDLETLPRQPFLVSAVEHALQQGQELAQVLLVSKEPILYGESEYVAQPNASHSSGYVSRPAAAYNKTPSESSANDTTALVSLSCWQSSPSTGLSQTLSGTRITLQDYSLVHTYRTLTCDTFPWATPRVNPWRQLTFDQQFKRPYLYHITLALTSAHLRHLQSVATPSVSEVSHYVKALSALRETLAHYGGRVTPAIPFSERRSLFGTFAMLGGYIWATEMTEIHSWLISKFSLTAGTREVVEGAWLTEHFAEFREAISDSLVTDAQTIENIASNGERRRVPILEAFAVPSSRLLPSTVNGEVSISIDDADDEIPDIYDSKYAHVSPEICPYWAKSKDSMVVDIGSLYRLAAIIRALESPMQPLPPATMTAVMRIIFAWPGICVREILAKLKQRDPRIYVLLGYYYASMIRAKQLSMSSIDSMLFSTGEELPQPNEVLRAWWLLKNQRLVLRGIVDWLGKEWEPLMEWPLMVLREEEAADAARIENVWAPVMDDMRTYVTEDAGLARWAASKPEFQRGKLDMAESRLRLKHDDYTVGWICASPDTELVAAGTMLDHEHDMLPAADPKDDNTYLLGSIGNHNVVIACLPAKTAGKVSAATVAKDMTRSFKAIRFGLMVGIGGGAPYYGAEGNHSAGGEAPEDEDSEEDDPEEIRDIRLGDVVVSLHSKSSEAVVQYDFGKSVQEREFAHIGGRLNKPPNVVLNAVSMLRGQHRRKGHKISELVSNLLSQNDRMAEFRSPGSARDQLLKPQIVHRDGSRACEKCCGAHGVNLVKRNDRPDGPKIHYGTIGSADQVMKDAMLRDRWSQKENIICFEKTAAGEFWPLLWRVTSRLTLIPGLMDSFPCLVIRGICDYADSHKNKIWQPYAAITAAAYAKELLLVIPGQGIRELSPIEQIEKQMTEMRNDVRDLKQTTDKTNEAIQYIVSTQQDEHRGGLLRWLSPIDDLERKEDKLRERQEGTDRLFLENTNLN
ncbi:hypothetical protein Dda_8355 [Drechslerella dactyloides]|uniref:Zn(2)-C6 fungal-type domain-containing protein n=1 Tax=Drechslerella dactyloides TaxID=74499 RepID=A0AAD6NH77_DREDA|nr:hypothetical protein Dda_8355 [Drechslerella dactyloides]